MAQDILNSKPGDTWPPEGASARHEEYQRYRQLFKGQHGEVFARVQKWLDRTPDHSIVYIVCNFPKLVSLVCADMLFGEQPSYIAGDEGSEVQQALDQIVKANKLHTVNYEMAISASWRGGVVYKNRFGPRRPGGKDESIIEQVNPRYYYPDLNPDSIKEIRGAAVAWTREFNDRTYLRKEIHTPGQIRNELWLMDGSELKRQVPLNTIPDYEGLPEIQQTGYDGLLVHYCPNWRLDDEFWGLSDYFDMESLVDELNNRISRISSVLDKHESPKLVLPPGMMQFDPATKRYYIRKESLDCIEVDDEQGANLPRYVVWDAQLAAAFQQIDRLLEMAFLVSETSPDAFGLGKQGFAESGRALKFRLIRTIAKINRKKLYFDEALKQALFVAQVLDTTHGSATYTPTEVSIRWNDGMPDDDLELAQIEQARIAAGNTSVESSIRRLDRLSGKALQDEMARIAAERRASMSLIQPPDARFGPTEEGEQQEGDEEE